MSKCPKCGNLCEPEDRYCGKCGRGLENSDSGGRVTQKAMDLTDIRYKLGMVYYKKGDLERAIEVWERVLEDNPEDSAVKSLIQEAQSESRSLR